LGNDQIRVIHNIIPTAGTIIQETVDIPLPMYIACKHPYVVTAFENWSSGKEIPSHSTMTQYGNLRVFRGLPNRITVGFGEKGVSMNQFLDPLIFLKVQFPVDCFKRMIDSSDIAYLPIV
jgi:hypothetical protein